jgi:hypothetical protein
MSTELSLSSRITVSPRQEGDGFLQAPSIVSTFALTDGSGDGQGNAMWHKELTIAADSSQTLDLTSLSVNAFGLSGSLYFWKIRTLYICNTSTTTPVTVFAEDAENNPWQSLYTVPVELAPGGTLLAMDRAGWLVSGSSKTIKIANDSTIYSIAGDTTSGSTVVSDIEDTDDIAVGMAVTGAGIPTGAKVVQKTASTITLNAAATATAGDVSLNVFLPDPVLVFSLTGVLD